MSANIHQSQPQHHNDISIGLATVPEIPSAIPLEVVGSIPHYVGHSSLLRVGPGRYDARHSDDKPFVISHWFDGLSLLHQFSLDANNNSVQYRNKFIVESLERSISNTPRSEWASFSFSSPDPCRSRLSRFLQLFVPQTKNNDPETGNPPIPNIGVTIQRIPGKGITIRSDVAYNLALDENTLETHEFFGFSKLNTDLKGTFSAAHGHFDANTGEFFNYVYDLSGPSGNVEYKIFRTDSTGKTAVIGKVHDVACYLHSFAVTENYVILIVWPFVLNPMGMLMTHSVADTAKFQHKRNTRFYVIPRHSNDNNSNKNNNIIAKYETQSFYCFHTINAYETETNDIVIDLCKYDDASIVSDFKLDKFRSLKKLSSSCLARITLPSVTTVTPSVFTDGQLTVLEMHDIELPRINPSKLRKPHQFVYGVSDDGNSPFGAISKVDVETRTRVVWTRDRIVTGEPIFVPNPEGISEDDGCLLVVVLDAVEKRSSLVILDARTMEELASAQVPQVVPLGFHGMVTSEPTGW